MTWHHPSTGSDMVLASPPLGRRNRMEESCFLYRIFFWSSVYGKWALIHVMDWESVLKPVFVRQLVRVDGVVQFFQGKRGVLPPDPFTVRRIFVIVVDAVPVHV